MSSVRCGIKTDANVRVAALSAPLLLLLAVNSAQAQTATGNLGVSITIDETCAVASIVNVAFGNVGLINADVPATGSFTVQCTTGTDYTISLGVGLGTGATVAERYMTSGADTVAYSLYRNGSHTQVWGTGTGETTSATGNGATQPYTVYGLVPIQATPPAGTYNDTVVISVDY